MNGSQPTYEFGPFRLDADKRLLLRAGEPVPLAPKILETLIALVEHRDRVMTKDELLQRIWGDTVVEEGGLTRNVSSCGRRSARSPTNIEYIVTVPGRGYRFVANVRESAPAVTPLNHFASVTRSPEPSGRASGARGARRGRHG